MNSKYFAEYKGSDGYQCFGSKITEWDDGSEFKGGYQWIRGPHPRQRCEDECSKHKECTGFMSYPLAGVSQPWLASLGCGLWQKGPLTLTADDDVTCYQKKIRKHHHIICVDTIRI